MRLFDGKKAARKILKELGEQIKKEKLRPRLAIIFVGNDESSKLYIKLKKAAGAKIGIEVREFKFNAQVKEEDIIKKIQELNQDQSIHGIIVQLPLPAIFSVERVVSSIDVKKDVDGFHKENRRLLEKEEPNFLPVLPLAITMALEDALKHQFTGKSILALVNSEIFGQTLKRVLEKKGANNVKYLVRNTCLVFGIEKEIFSTDILISVCGCPNLIKAGMIKEDAILIDAGVTRYFNGKILGDIDQKSVESKADFLTPVPGGIGPLTVALLLRNVYLSAAK